MATSKIFSQLQSPLGVLTIAGDRNTITHIFMDQQKHAPDIASWQYEAGAFAEARQQLSEYFSGERKEFSLPLAPFGTAFQQTVWYVLQKIPSGETWSYGQLATALGRPGAARAVGAANGRNPLTIVIPCHRVIGAGGKPTGYAGGLERKAWLLAHERCQPVKNSEA